MLRLSIRLGLIIFGTLSVAAGLIRAQPYTDGLVQQLLVNNGCPAPCFLGIYPGETTAAEALALLRAHAWVDAGTIAYRDSDYGGGAVWSWRDNASPLLGARQAGFVSSPRQGVQVVDLVHITTTIVTGDIYLTLGANAYMMIGETGMKDEAYIALFYPEHGISVWSNFPCPSYNDHIWKHPVIVQYRVAGVRPQIVTRKATC